MAKGEKSESGIRWNSPLVIVGGGVIVALIFGGKLIGAIKDFFSGLKGEDRFEPTNEPAGPSRTGVITAVFDVPGNNGRLVSAYFPLGQVEFKIGVNNPEDTPQTVDLVVEVTWYPRITGEKVTTKASNRVSVAAGRTTHRMTMTRPYVGGSVVSDIDGVGLVSVNGVATGSVAFSVS